jgi:hypothetical protein
MRQINAAIEHLQRGDFECAITLAAAAEGILPQTDDAHFHQKIKALEASLQGIDEGATGANDYINWLKHGTLKQDGPRIENARITELAVTGVISRAISKFEAVYVTQEADRTPQMLEFANWARVYLSAGR